MAGAEGLMKTTQEASNLATGGGYGANCGNISDNIARWRYECKPTIFWLEIGTRMNKCTACR